MKMDHIDISGITPQSNLPECPYNYPCKEICETYKLCVPKSKPDIETILQLFIDTSIEKSHVLYTPMGNKLIIYGNIHFKILYVAKTACQSVHSAHFDIPFCTFILSSSICNHIKNTSLFVEDTFINQFNSRNFFISIVMLVYPEFNKQNNPQGNTFNKNNFNYILDESNSDPEYYMQSSTSHSNFKDVQSDSNPYDKYNMKFNKHLKNQNNMVHGNSSDIKCNFQYGKKPHTNSYKNHQKDYEFHNEHDIQYDIDYDMTPSTHTNINYNNDNEYKIECDIEFDYGSDYGPDYDTSIDIENENEHFEYEWE